MLRQCRNPLRRQAAAILQRPPLAAFAGGFGTSNRARSRRTQPITVWPAAGAVDQPGAHEPGVQQQAHVAKPLAEQMQQQAGAAQLARGWCRRRNRRSGSRHRADGEVVALDHRRQAQPALTAQESAGSAWRCGCGALTSPAPRSTHARPRCHRSRRTETTRRTSIVGTSGRAAQRPQPGPASLLEEPVSTCSSRARGRLPGWRR